MIDFELSSASVLVLCYAGLISALRRSASLALSDLVGALFITNSERLGKYWKDLGAFEDFVTGEPGVREAILLHRAGGFETRLVQEGFHLGPHEFSYLSDLAETFTTAKELALSRGDVQSGTKPVVAPEDLLLAVAKQAGLPIAQRLIGSGLDLERLEEAVKTIKELRAFQSPSE